MDKRIILLAPEDNCLVTTMNLEPGTSLEFDGKTVVLDQAFSIGHKLARYALSVGDKVIKYGAVIGHATQNVPVGGHLHTHNLESDYLPTYTHETGKAFVAK